MRKNTSDKVVKRTKIPNPKGHGVPLTTRVLVLLNNVYKLVKG